MASLNLVSPLLKLSEIFSRMLLRIQTGLRFCSIKYSDGLPGTEGPELQKALLDMTGQNTVPNIFVKGKHIGGCDDTLAAIGSGELQKMLQ